MKKALSILGMLLLLVLGAGGQTVELVPDQFHSSQLADGRQPIPYPFLREADILWSTTLWKTISTEELFNQFFYFPNDDERTYGKKGLAYILWDAMASGEIPVFEDSELKVPLDHELFVKHFTRADTIQLEIGYDDDDNELYETIIRPRYFEGSDIHDYTFREVWFIGRQDSRQDSRRVALAPLKILTIDLPDGKIINQGKQPLFWVPLLNIRVRSLLARHTAHIDPNNMVGQPSWDWVFVNQHYSAYLTRESNTYNRSISTYVTGTDALYEAERIESKVFDLGEDMWEY